MRLDVAANTPSHVGLYLALKPDEIARLIKQLQGLQADAEQHFHLTSDEDQRFLDIEISTQGSDQAGNAAMSSFAIDPAPGT